MTAIIRLTAIVLGLAIFAPAIPAFAEVIEALKPGEAIAIMPDGHMARAMITDAKKLEELKTNAKPIPWCKMLMLGEDGQVWLMNTDQHNPMVTCEVMVPGSL
jgi:hypothetical protein